MVEALRSRPEPAVERSLDFLEELFRGYGPREFGIRLWDGTTLPADPGLEERFTLVFRSPGVLRRMFLNPSELSFGEAYVHGEVDIEGSLDAVFPVADRLLASPRHLAKRAGLALRLLRLPRDTAPRAGRAGARLRGRRHSLERDRQAVTFHYDLSNDFFRLFLDERLVYSCAYFASAEDSLDSAQEQKLDYLCRKLRLEPGERLLDVGCGWGALVLHAAERFGVEATGITLSEPQARLAGERIRAAGLQGRCRVDVLDYRELDELSTYDKVVSVGMFEHVGEERLQEYFRLALTLLKPGGAFLNHGIARRAGPWRRRRHPTFWERYVFPDGDLTTISGALAAAEAAGFEVRDVESLREHYELTLRHWVHRLEENAGDAQQVVDPVTFRVWRLYTAAAAYRFRVNRLSVYQALLVRPDEGRSKLPLTRADWYREESS